MSIKKKIQIKNLNIDACLTRGVLGIVFMSVLKRSKPRYCSSDEYTSRQQIVNRIMKNKAVAHYAVHYFKPTSVYRDEYEALDGVHFTEEGYRAFLVALRKALSWVINKVNK
jgi:lysophospholipase L1-like esterase